MKTPFIALALVSCLASGLLFVREAQAGPTVPTVTQREPRVWTGSNTFSGGITVSGPMAFSSTIDFAASSGGVAFSSAITVTGAAVNDSCHLGPPAAAAALLGQYGCVVTAANEIKVWFRPGSIISTTCTLGGESPSVCPAQTVTASSVCTCTNVGTTAAIAANGCAVSLSGTTLTITSANGATNVVNYSCRAPVDPASSTFEGYVVHN